MGRNLNDSFGFLFQGQQPWAYNMLPVEQVPYLEIFFLALLSTITAMCPFSQLVQCLYWVVFWQLSCPNQKKLTYNNKFRRYSLFLKDWKMKIKIWPQIRVQSMRFDLCYCWHQFAIRLRYLKRKIWVWEIKVLDR